VGVPDPVASRSTLAAVADPGPAPSPHPPRRALLRVAGVLTQLTCGVCLLIGTIALVLVAQNKSGGLGVVAAWLATAMAGLVFGGLIYRGGTVSMVAAAVIDAAFGSFLIAIEYDTLRALLRILPASDVDTIGTALDVAGFAMIGAGVACLVAIPQGLRFARWFRGAAATGTAMSTARGFPPPPVPVRGSVFIIPADEQPASRRRLYLVLGGLAIAVGVGVGILVSSTHGAAPAGDAAPRPAPGSAHARPRDAVAVAAPGAGSDPAHAVAAPPSPPSPPSPAAPSSPSSSPPSGTAQDLVAAQHAAIALADARALGALLTPAAFGFGIDADEVAEGRDAVVGQLVRDLGEPPPGGFTVASTAFSIGAERGHAWISDEIELGAPDRPARQLTITELAAVIDGRWQVVALHWAAPVPDATAERRAILGTLPRLQPIPDRHDGPDALDRAVRAAFASRAAFAAARSERVDAFNYGSGGERAHGGATIKRIFARLKAQIRLHDGARIVAGGAWDPAQRAAPWIGWAAVNVEFTQPTRAATEVTQTFRVLAILLKEGDDWKIVQTHWSNGGPIR
jgi:hypothetical protein